MFYCWLTLCHYFLQMYNNLFVKTKSFFIRLFLIYLCSVILDIKKGGFGFCPCRLIFLLVVYFTTVQPRLSPQYLQ